MPSVAPAQRLAGVARAAGWDVRVTYAVAEVPDRYFDNGNLAKGAHRIASVVVRLRRIEMDLDVRGWATWLAQTELPEPTVAWVSDEAIPAWLPEDGGGWHFDHAYVALTRYGLRAGKTHAGIYERITRP